MRQSSNQDATMGVEFENRVWDLWGELLLERETQQLISEVEEDRKAPLDIQLHAAFLEQDKKNLRLINQSVQRNPLKVLKSIRLPRALHVAALFLAAFTLVSGVALAASSILRVEVMKLLAITTPKYTELKLVIDENASFDFPAEWKGSNYLSFVPDGFERTKLVSRSGISQVEYRGTSSRDETIVLFFAEYGKETAPNVDSEGAIQRSVNVSGHSGTLLLEDSSSIIYWTDGYKTFVLTSINISVDMLLRVAEGIKPIK